MKMAVKSLAASYEIDSVHCSKSFLSFRHCDAEQCMPNHCAKRLTSQLLLYLMPSHSTETALSQTYETIYQHD